MVKHFMRKDQSGQNEKSSPSDGFFPVFLSIVVVVENQANHLDTILKALTETIMGLVADYELIIVDNASADNSVACLKQLTGESGLPNLQVYALTNKVDIDTASWVGLENALGDFIAVLDPLTDEVEFVPNMLNESVLGADLVFAYNRRNSVKGTGYLIARLIFNHLWKWFTGIDLNKEVPRFRILSKRVVNFLIQYPQPVLAYRHLASARGFVRSSLTYTSSRRVAQRKRFSESVDLGIRLLVSTTRAPMRLVTTLSLFGAFANIVYSLYVIAIGIFKEDVAPGWISLSLQQSGMFFLISLVLFVLGEYILNIVRVSNEGPLYHVGQEFTSARILRREKLNIEDLTTSASSGTE